MTITGGATDQARGCKTSNCSLGTETFQLAGTASVAGSVDLDIGALTLDFLFTALSITLNESTAGTEDNGVAKIMLSDVTYSGSVAVTQPVPGTFVLDPFALATVAGDQMQLDDGGDQVNPNPPDFSTDGAARLSGLCQLVGDALTCGLTFGTTEFEIAVGDPGDGMEPETRYFQHTANIVAVPEPSTAALIGLALVTASCARRRS